MPAEADVEAFGSRGWYVAWAVLLVFGVAVLWALAVPGIVVGIYALRHGPRRATLLMGVADVLSLGVGLFW